MDIDKFRHFCAVAETSSIRRAAELLKISSGALSKSIKQFEATMGAELVATSGRGIMLTDRGKRLYPRCRALLVEYNELRRHASGQHSHVDPTLRLGSFEVFSTYVFSWLAKNELKELPVTLQELEPGNIEAAVRDARIDVGITYVPFPGPEIDHLSIVEFEMGLFAHPAAFTGLDLSEIPFAIPTTSVESSPIAIESLDGWPSSKVPRHCPYKLELMESALQLAQDGRAAIYCPEFIARLSNARVAPNLRLAPMACPFKPAKQTVYLVKRTSYDEDGLVRRIARGLRKVCKPA